MNLGSIIDDRFVLESLAGEGGMGVVFRARDLRSERPVAVKVMHVHGRAEIARFVREAQILSSIVHPNIVEYLAHGVTSEGEPFIAMEWLNGAALVTRLRDGALSVRETLQIALGVCRALDAAHRQGIVHRDVKPGNILCLPDGRVKLVDFGVARITTALHTLTGTGRLLGTPGYIAPEQARGSVEVDGRADLFSLGCVMHECLTGQAAFSGEHALAVLAKVVLDEPPRASELIEGIPAALDELVFALLAKQPDRRPANAAEVIRQLDALSDEIGRSKTTFVPTSRRGITRRERQVVSVVVAAAASQETIDSVDGEPITPLSLALDAFGVPAERLVDGTIACVIRPSGAATDLAVRAARCALALRAHLPSAPIVVSTGRGVLAGRLPVGEVIDRAVSTLRGLRDQNVPDGAIRVDDLTAGLLDARFEVHVDPSGLWLTRERDKVDPSRTLLGRHTPLVGRERDLSFVEATLLESINEGASRSLLVTAEPGLGKSRLAAELIARWSSRPGIELFLGRADPVSQGAPFGLVSQLIRRASGVDFDDPLPARPRKIAARVTRNLASDDAVRVASFLSELCGFHGPSDPRVERDSIANAAVETTLLSAARRDPQIMGDQISRAWVDFLAAETENAAVVLMLDDLQWGDLPSIHLIDAALRRLVARPLLVLAFARPEVRKVFPALWEQRGLHELHLAKLGTKTCERLVRGSIPGAPDDAVHAIVERADGNPFFLEELTRAAFAGRLDRLPDTVLAMAQSRLDTIDAEGRQLLRGASVFGDVFAPDALVEMLDAKEKAAEVDACVARLEAAEVIERVATSEHRDGAAYRFRHGLLREAAYASLTEVDRSFAHRAAARWLERNHRIDAVALAHHHELGGDGPQAARWIEAAARQSLAGNDLDAVIERVERAISLGAEGETRGRLRFLACEAHKWRGEFSKARACGEDALVDLPRGAAWFAAAGELGVVLGMLGQREQLCALSRQVIETSDVDAIDRQTIAAGKISVHLLMQGESAAAEAVFVWMDALGDSSASRDPAVVAQVSMARGFRAVFEGDPSATLRMMELSAQASTQAGDLRRGCGAKLNAAFSAIELGAFESAARSLRELLRQAEMLGLAPLVTDAHQNLGLALARLGRVGEAIAHEVRAIAEYHARSQPRAEGVARSYLALALMRSGQLELARVEAVRAVQILGGTPPRQAFALAVISEILRRQRRAVEAYTAALGARSILESLGGIDEGEAAVRLAYVHAAIAMGRTDDAASALIQARDRLLDRAAKISDPAWRASFLGNVEVHDETLSLATSWLGLPTATNHESAAGGHATDPRARVTK